MARGYRATPRQASAGRRNLLKAQVTRIGIRGERKRREGMRGMSKNIPYKAR